MALPPASAGGRFRIRAIRALPRKPRRYEPYGCARCSDSSVIDRTTAAGQCRILTGFPWIRTRYEVVLGVNHRRLAESNNRNRCEQFGDGRRLRGDGGRVEPIHNVDCRPAFGVLGE
jgi:hypothetical protein